MPSVPHREFFFLWFSVPVAAHGQDISEPNMCAIPMSLNKNSHKFACLMTKKGLLAAKISKY